MEREEYLISIIKRLVVAIRWHEHEMENCSLDDDGVEEALEIIKTYETGKGNESNDKELVA